jgi:hypothetical protein
MVQQIGMLGFFFMYMVVGKDKGPLDPLIHDLEKQKYGRSNIYAVCKLLNTKIKVRKVF